MNFYEIIGEKEVQIHRLEAEKFALIKMIKQLKEGTKTLDDIKLEMPDEVAIPVEASANGHTPGA